LAGAAFVVPETDIPASAGPLDLGKVHGFKAALP
jgi:serine/threonine-protein kinase HipA